MQYKIMALLLWWSIVIQLCFAEPLLVPSPKTHTREHALRFQRTANTTLAPVYAPLAETIVAKFELQTVRKSLIKNSHMAEKEGIGIDLGSGPGTLIIELCKRTKRIHWVNADINPHFFPLFFESAEQAGIEQHRISAIFADAQALPLKDNYADIIVSRGSFHFWEDKKLGFSEIYRVLKPGGAAFIGRGFSENLPVEVARKVREKQKGGPKYDVAKTADELRGIMMALEIEDYQIHLPKPPGSEGVNYGVWLEFHKPSSEKNEPK